MSRWLQTTAGWNRKWLLALVLLIAAQLTRVWLNPFSLQLPATPVDQVNVPLAQQFMLLLQAREVVPEGSSFSVAARTPEDEMSLFMLSLGVLVKRQAVPRSYYGAAVHGFAPADYVVSYGCVGAPANSGHVEHLLDGCVWSSDRRK